MTTTTLPAPGRFTITLAGAVLATAVFAAAGTATAADAQAATATAGTLGRLVNERIGLHRSELIRVDFDPAPGVAKEAVIRIGDEPMTLALKQHSLRSDDFHVYAWRDGGLHEVEPGPVRTYRGTIVGDAGSVVSGGIGDAGLSMRIVTGDRREFWVEPIGPHVLAALDRELAAALDGFHVVYRAEDLIDTGATCGTASLAEEAVSRGDVMAGASGGDSVCEIAFDVDNRYILFNPQSVERIETIFASVSPIYEDDVDITYDITTFILREEPYYNIPATMSTYLTIFTNEWRNNQQGVQRDVAELFTGWGFPDAAGIAWLSGVCNRGAQGGYNVVSNRIALAERVHVSAHELAHNWSADHCTCAGFIMPPSFPPTSTMFHPTFTIPEIVAFRNTRNCLGSPPPANDDCANAQPVGDGIVAFDSGGATTDGPALPGNCDEGGGLDFVKDVWFDYTASCTGTATATTCISGTFDTRLAVYAGSGCVGSFLACNNDACGPGGLQSQLTFPVAAGQRYRVRIGGVITGGTGILSMACAPGPVCPEDLDMSGAVDFGDILAVLSAWGNAGGPEDLDGSGTVDFGDLLEILGAWGPCPV